MKIKAFGKLYDFPNRPLELGEQRLLKREFGFVPGCDELDLRDPDHMAAFVYAAMRNQDPDAPAKSLLASINRLREVELVGDDGEPLSDEQVEEASEGSVEDPTSVAAEGSGV